MGVVGPLLTAFLTAINIGLALRTIWRDRQERRAPKAHPLDPALRDIAAAIRAGRAA